jgi:hypothetical protein
MTDEIFIWNSWFFLYLSYSWCLEFSQLFWNNSIIKDILFLRLKCGEFLQLLIGHVNGRDSPPLASIHEDTRRLLGETSASLIWAASQFGSTLDPEQRLTALQIQARRILESLDLYWMLNVRTACNCRKLLVYENQHWHPNEIETKE